jgi:hypothetical protein
VRFVWGGEVWRFGGLEAWRLGVAGWSLEAAEVEVVEEDVVEVKHSMRASNMLLEGHPSPLKPSSARPSQETRAIGWRRGATRRSGNASPQPKSTTGTWDVALVDVTRAGCSSLARIQLGDAVGTTILSHCVEPLGLL